MGRKRDRRGDVATRLSKGMVDTKINYPKRGVNDVYIAQNFPALTVVIPAHTGDRSRMCLHLTFGSPGGGYQQHLACKHAVRGSSNKILILLRSIFYCTAFYTVKIFEHVFTQGLEQINPNDYKPSTK